ncbi:MAG TPA: hypothetical protein VH592_24205 [Gemmataceae bacterium]|jgi:hypothetical protein
MGKRHEDNRQEAGEQPDRCELCDRQRKLTKHHLVPRAVHSKKRYVNRFGKKEMRQRGLMICKECHNGIHDLIPGEKELADKYHTKELLLANEAIQKHITWVKKQK